KHMLTQEVTYNLMLFAQRRQLHHAVAEWYELSQAGDLSPYYAVLAYHWQRAENLPKTLEYLGRAGEQALQRGAYREAVGFFEDGLKLNPDASAEDRLRSAHWRRQLGDAHLNLGHMTESRQHLSEAVATLGFPVPQQNWKLVVKLAGQALRQTCHRLFPTW